MELDKLKEDQDPHMSGAYIRSLVKQLRPKDPINQNSSSVADADGDGGTANNLSKMPENQRTHPTQHHKKQVRRRLHTTRPYQERLLNMAEARREIVTALKFHRAAMKKAAGDQQPQTPPEPPDRSCVVTQEGKIRPRKIPKTYPSSSSSTENNIPSNYVHNFTSKNFCYPSFPSNSFAWSPFPIAASHSVADNLDIALPEQTLGLNLNFQDFNNLDANLFTNGSASSSSSSIATDQEAPHSISAAASDVTESNGTAGSGSGSGSGSGVGGGGGGGLHVAVGDEEMAEIRSIGEKHEMEWSDKMNLVKSAWWFRFMKAEEEEEEEEEEEGFQIHHPFDQILEFPDWMNNGNERRFEEQLLNDYCSEDYHFFHDDPALPCMDIGEFEGMDGEWLA